ncbi:MAG: hypothetical protein EXQ49_08095 [Acidobacteria bacterium]|nr:hypothetical protein [Acidobacteriota bacterium]
MTHQTWTYPEELTVALLSYGLKPTATTPPQLVRDALNDLYRYEIRRLRQRRHDGLVEKSRYVDEVILLRKRYWPLTLQPDHWLRICQAGGPGLQPGTRGTG